MPYRVQELTPLTPSLTAIHALNPQRYPFLLQSTAQGISSIQSPASARYDILFAFPQQRLTLKGDGQLQGCVDPHTGFLSALDRLWQNSPRQIDGAEYPFNGGWFLYLGYELAGEVEPSIVQPQWKGQLPIATAVRIPAAIIIDHTAGKIVSLVEPGFESMLDEMDLDIHRVMATSPAADATTCHDIIEEPSEQYLQSIDRAKRYIQAGDIFQANLSRLWQGTASGDNYVALYERLCKSNPAPFAGLAQLDNAVILCSSPERLVRVHGRHIETRPIAGTHPRDPQQSLDPSARKALIGHPKERAEHIMLVDLERNDLGRLCTPGTIKVTELLGLETYAHVHHIVSNIDGELRLGVTPGQVIRATFPGGTITGCPKVRCMEIIAELEASPRGPYTGSMGYLNHDGSMDLNILIRTMWIEAEQLYFRAGGGIVADSIPETELLETRAKAKGLLQAIHQSAQKGSMHA